MFSLVYVSSATELFTPAQLDALLERSRENNAKRSVTGLLLYRDGNFMQLLEGDEATVQSLYRQIASDFRHHGCQVLLTSEADQRMFTEWSMAFRRVEASEDLPDGYSEFLRDTASSSDVLKNPSHAKQLLFLFRQMMR
jgi:hypothetical protein